MIPSDIIAYIPSEIFCNNGFCIDGEFHTIILQRTDILGQLRTELHTNRNSDGVQQILRFTIVTINISSDTVVQKAEVETSIISSSSLPLQVGVISRWTHCTIVSITKGILGKRVA